MCSFCITYEDGKFLDCSHVKSAGYNGSSQFVTVPEDQLCTHRYPIGRSIWLYLEDGMCCINGTGARSIEVHQE